MTLYIVPGKAEIVAVIWIYSKPQQLALNARACETASGILMRHLRRHHLGETGKCLFPWHFLERQPYLPRNFRRVCASLYRPLKYHDFVVRHISILPQPIQVPPSGHTPGSCPWDMHPACDSSCCTACRVRDSRTSPSPALDHIF